MLVNQNLSNYAARFGLSLDNRCGSDSWVYDGNGSIAIRANEKQIFSSAEILHEIGHWHACLDPEQRLYPEFGLHYGIVCSYWGDDFSTGLLSDEEQEIQEYTTHLITVYLGPKLNIKPVFGFNRSFRFNTWNQYHERKVEDAKIDFPNVWEYRLNAAKQRFNSLIPSLGI